MANLGYVGLGAMGSRVVKRLLDAGHTVTGYNRTKSKAQGKNVHRYEHGQSLQVERPGGKGRRKGSTHA